MKSIILLFLACCVTAIFGSQPVISNTRTEGCFDGRCGSHCSWEQAKLFPGDNLNQQGKCRLLACTKDFDVKVTKCESDPSGKFEWVGADSKKAYPECCGTKSLKKGR